MTYHGISKINCWLVSRLAKGIYGTIVTHSLQSLSMSVNWNHNVFVIYAIRTIDHTFFYSFTFMWHILKSKSASIHKAFAKQHCYESFCKLISIPSERARSKTILLRKTIIILLIPCIENVIYFLIRDVISFSVKIFITQWWQKGRRHVRRKQRTCCRAQLLRSYRYCR